MAAFVARGNADHSRIGIWNGVCAGFCRARQGICRAGREHYLRERAVFRKGPSSGKGGKALEEILLRRSGRRRNEQGEASVELIGDPLG